jgi:hypothetical protein
MNESRTTALGIPCPWSGDEHDPPDWRYAVWFQIYRRSRVVRHWIGLHDGRKCSWCGSHYPHTHHGRTMSAGKTCKASDA